LRAHARDCTRKLISCRGPTRADRQAAAYLHLGPRERLRTKAYKLPWANSSRSAGDSIFTLRAHARDCTRKLISCRGPTQADRQVAAYLHCGPTRGIARIYKLLRANSSSSAGGSIFTFGPTRGVAHESLQTAVGQLEPIGRQQHIHTAGPREGSHTKVYKLPWANNQADRQAAAY
jgi:hypothetical protein